MCVIILTILIKKMKNELKIFLLKLISIVFAIILIINTTYNLIFAEKIETLTKFLSFKENKIEMRNKIRSELYKALEKDKILHTEDKILLKKLYFKLKNEFESE